VAVIVFMEVVMDTLLARIGGADAVKAVVESFYDKVFADEQLMPFFANTDQAKQRNRQSKFLIQMMDGKAPNAADYMRTAHSAQRTAHSAQRTRSTSTK